MKYLILIAAFALVGCKTSKGIDANQAKIAEGTRAIVGTSLIGTKGKTRADNRKIGATVSRLCSTEVWTAAQCEQHDRLSRAQ